MCFLLRLIRSTVDRRGEVLQAFRYPSMFSNDSESMSAWADSSSASMTRTPPSSPRRGTSPRPSPPGRRHMVEGERARVNRQQPLGDEHGCPGNIDSLESDTPYRGSFLTNADYVRRLLNERQGLLALISASAAMEKSSRCQSVGRSVDSGCRHLGAGDAGDETCDDADAAARAAAAPSAALPDVPHSPVPPPTPPPSPVQLTSAGGAPLRPTFALVAYNLRPPPPPPFLPCRIATISNIVRSSFPTFRRRSALLVAKRCLSSRPAAAFARTTALADVAVLRSFVRMNAEKISDTLAFVSPALALHQRFARDRPACCCSGGAP
ncbi:hypothetical protein THAOC_08362 [Thalassiosira oceanica]|uniref:Uncharacterized protein n=1 Tax=Thalassiosira oceanica TaxID=159749 RepID=K0SY35_THAOC|nr:hypothetical protein THAOC_08362 [Thalassiosira oceanica]|eukprot:EJK70290.1 hypothetical protein THAOC_08362 [Thalassiosira oceanica]